MSSDYPSETSFAYGPRPVTRDDNSGTIPAAWYPGPTVAMPDPPTKITPLDPPTECIRCHHLFVSVEAWNAHADACYAKPRRT